MRDAAPLKTSYFPTLAPFCAVRTFGSGSILRIRVPFSWILFKLIRSGLTQTKDRPIAPYAWAYRSGTNTLKSGYRVSSFADSMYASNHDVVFNGNPSSSVERPAGPVGFRQYRPDMFSRIEPYIGNR